MQVDTPQLVLFHSKLTSSTSMPVVSEAPSLRKPVGGTVHSCAEISIVLVHDRPWYVVGMDVSKPRTGYRVS